jgi:predicted GH43/DUF377 family glycosyl hydrolase
VSALARGRVPVWGRAPSPVQAERSSEPIFTRQKDWEKVGQVPNVVFVEGAVPQGDHYLFYYGGADKYVGVAQTEVSPGAALIAPPK